MRLRSDWHCVAGIYFTADRKLSVVWLGHDKQKDTVHVFDSVTLQHRAAPVVMAERINAGNRRWLPIAWFKSSADLAEKLSICGCNMEPEPVDETDAKMETLVASFEERLISERIKVDKDLQAWSEEYKTLRFQDNKFPKETYPLMAATLCAFAQLDYARKRPRRHQVKGNYPKVAIV